MEGPSAHPSASDLSALQNEKFCTFSRPRLTPSIATSFVVTSYLDYVWQPNCLKDREIQIGPEFLLFSQPVLVALDTDQGVVYAPASGWDKVCLLWTFRNFRSLPQTVLSPRQQQLIASLYRETSGYPSNELHQAAIVGTVEGFRPSSLPSLAASTKSRKPASVPGRKPFHARFAFSGNAA